MLGKYAHSNISRGGRLSYIFTKVTYIAETFTILMLRISAVWILLSYEKEVYCVGFEHHS